MPVFKDAQFMLEILGGLFRLALQDETAAPKFREAGVVIKFNITDPDGTLWVDSVNMRILTGPQDLKANVEMDLSGDSCHQFWLKELKLPIALAKRKIKARGPMPTILKLLPLLKPAYEMYPEIARKNNLPIQGS
ncbi:MAG: SCP2 sterol-binding domain-containing protein [Syntrophobacterales bacterium]|nr:SCP2 sterol-binding domain-containing protein [Syntrophobacterales bacterium]